MSEDSQSLGLVVEQSRIVRSDQLAIVAADPESPRVLADQPTDHLGILCGAGEDCGARTLILSWPGA
jgi:hypothetical protein